ncbi:hypothetical protein JCM10212_006406 [Sporobolomyces blumeae]
MTISHRLVQQSDIPRAYDLESASYPQDEAASLDSLEYRQKHASDLFLGAYLSDGGSPSPSPASTLVGYICSTRTSSPVLTHASMETHEPTGAYVAIHSVCVDPNHRNEGIAKRLLERYVDQVKAIRDEQRIKGIRLIAKEGLVKMYEKAGFTLVGKSDVVHGQDPWYELAIDFDEPSSTDASPLVDDVESDAVRSPGKLVSNDASAVPRLVATRSTSTPKVLEGTNLADLYCPRQECRCLLVKKGTAKWVRQHAQDVELPALPTRIGANIPSSSTATRSSTRGYWSLSSPLAFENIGFTRSVPPQSSASGSSNSDSTARGGDQQEIKYLTCADCDFGPLGWHDTQGRDLGLEVQVENERKEGDGDGGEKDGREGQVRQGREFLIDVERVRYKLD